MASWFCASTNFYLLCDFLFTFQGYQYRVENIKCVCLQNTKRNKNYYIQFQTSVFNVFLEKKYIYFCWPNLLLFDFSLDTFFQHSAEITVTICNLFRKSIASMTQAAWLTLHVIEMELPSYYLFSGNCTHFGFPN